MKQGREVISFDYAMKYILREKSNFDILEGFLYALLNEEVKILEILESENNKNDIDLKSNRVDLLTRDEQNRRMIIEIQYAAESDYLQRLLYETSRTIRNNLSDGARYEEVIKVISISISYFDIGTKCVYKGEMSFRDIKTKENLIPEKADKYIGIKSKKKNYKEIFPEYYLINTRLFNDNVETDLDDWIYMFKNSEVREGATAKSIDKAKERLDVLKMSKKERSKYNNFLDERRKSASQYHTAYTEGIEQGIKQGIKQGIEQNKKEFVKRGLDKKISIAMIAELAELSIEEVKAIIKNLS
ncbi:Rpn family recombination-promoting nuclease/putative transposase [Candidatus Epulonipiscium viviparus]|uniref:Rpn family recombination-promoting nuclease/putative transposase n=1 Tax=Candidatus Epulonipiscium viviparus TaxID=420336 RepID=UPI00016C0F0B|nr:Rpn family recombination-promoting nuclease/putative transposase [Candidatus Epulopiscium viviparus]